MCQNKFFLFIRSRKRKASRPHRCGLISLGTIIMAGLGGFFLSAQAQPVGLAVATPVSTNYQGLKTTRTYQPLPSHTGSNNPAAVRVVPINDELRNSYHIDPFYKKTLTSAGVVIVGSDKVSDWAF